MLYRVVDRAQVVLPLSLADHSFSSSNKQTHTCAICRIVAVRPIIKLPMQELGPTLAALVLKTITTTSDKWRIARRRKRISEPSNWPH